MLEVFKAFYPTHYNLAALSVLLLLVGIFLITKRSFKVAWIPLALLVALNVCIYKKTNGKAWTITLEPEKQESFSEYSFYHEPKTMTFSVANWEITDEKGEKHHWCWIEDLWEMITNTDVVAAIWGENAGKKVKQSTESRVNDAENLN